MAEAEQPERLRHDRPVTVDDVRQLMGPPTPHFATQHRRPPTRGGLDPPLRDAAANPHPKADPHPPARGPRPPARRGGDRAPRAPRVHGGAARRARPARPAPPALARRRRAAALRRGPHQRVTLSAGLERAIGLLDPARRPPSPVLSRPEASPPASPQPDGYLDLLGGTGRTGGRPAQRLMVTRALPVVYERWWRPAWGRVLMGPLGPGMEGERRIAHELMALTPGDTVLDLACGPGNFVRDFAEAVGRSGLVVGLDASATMLARAVRDTRPAPNVAYIRGDAVRLPFRDGAFDAVCCFAAVHLFDEPLEALDAMARGIAPGG